MNKKRFGHDGVKSACNDQIKLKHQGVFGFYKLLDIIKAEKYKGTNNKVLRIFINEGAKKLYSWNGIDQKWIKAGEATGNVKIMEHYGGDKIFPAGQYEYIFNIQIGNGAERRLPYNSGDNPMEAADKFCIRKKIARYYSKQIVDFITKNADNTHADSVVDVMNVKEKPKKEEAKIPSLQYESFKDNLNLEKAFNITKLSILRSL